MNSSNHTNCTGSYRLYLTLALCLAFNSLSAQQNSDYAVNANIIYRVTKYIVWPAASTQTGDFVIGIVGDSPLYDELKKITAGKKVDKQKILIMKYPASTGTFNCHMLFVPDEESFRFNKILAKTSNSGTLIISESEGLASEGSCINFVLIDDRLKLEINKRNIENRDLKIASDLLQLGIAVK